MANLVSNPMEEKLQLEILAQEESTEKFVGLEASLLPPNIQAQLDRYFVALAEVDKTRSQPRAFYARESEALKFKASNFIYSRDKRVDDLASEEVQTAIRIKTTLFPYGVPRLIICLDGRVLGKLMAGLHGNAMRVPAGDSQDFIPKKSNGELMLVEGELSHTVDRTMKHTDLLVEVFDSHVGCAARNLEEFDRYFQKFVDNGLRYDVLRKKAQITALSEYVQRKYAGSKKIIAIQTSFEPTTGYCYMGLELCVDDVRVFKDGFSKPVIDKNHPELAALPDVLGQLVNEGKILYTRHLVDTYQGGVIRQVFERNQFPLDYESNYRVDTLRFWQAIDSMKPEVLPIIEQAVADLFRGRISDPKEVTQRAVFLLANSFGAFLQNQNGSYRYAEHDESVIVGTYSEKGPFDRARSFSINPDNVNFSKYVKLARDLIRQNRQAGRMSQLEKQMVSKLFPSRDTYTNVPILFIQFERVKDVLSDIAKVQNADWSDLPKIRWMTMTDGEFTKYLESKVREITTTTAKAINKLRHRAINLYRPGLPSTEAILEGGIAPLWILASQDRRTLAFLPFLTAGYEEGSVHF
jgi:hypothetical protein